MAFSLSIGGTDITNYIAASGFQWERNDIDAPNSGRDMTGTMRRAIVARKDKIEVTCRRLTTSELNTLTGLLAPAVVTVSFYCPGDASVRSNVEFYSSKINSGVVMSYDNTILLDGIKFSLIEV